MIWIIFRCCPPVLASLLLSLLLAPGPAWAQERPPSVAPYASERPGGSASDPLEQPRDLLGRSVKTPRVRALHGPAYLPGSTPWLIEHDPWLAYQRGRELCQREFSAADGAFGESGRLRGKVLDDGATLMGGGGHVNSCIGCHNSPWRDMGAGITIQKNSGSGRNTPHGFGGGLVEMIGQEIRRQLLAQADLNHDGWISLQEARGNAVVQSLDFGSFADKDGDGRPDLNPIVYVWYVDKDGQRIPWARTLNAPGVAGYGLEVQVFGFGQRDRVGHGALSSTLRAVSSNAFDIHSGLQAHDPTANSEPHHDGLALVSLCGAQQFVAGFTRDVGTVCGPHGISLDDPDRDGVVEEISEGDLDLVEFFQLNHPAPAEVGGPRFERGRALAHQVGCLECHVPDWKLPGDRRFYDLQVKSSPDGLEGRVRRLDASARTTPFTVAGVYSDFRQHDLGPAFHEVQYDGSQNLRFRTSPLWGVGSSAPYGHDGASLSLDQVIRRHGGEAASATERYRSLSEAQRDDLLGFLQGLVLYSTETLPTDIDGDGVISQHFQVAGQDTGLEVFNPEWLFEHPVQIEGPVVAPDGLEVISRAAVNLVEAYGLDLPGLRDRNHDGFADWLRYKPRRGLPISSP